MSKGDRYKVIWVSTTKGKLEKKLLKEQRDGWEVVTVGPSRYHGFGYKHEVTLRRPS